MTRSKVLKRKTSGCCWRKLLGKALKRDPNMPGVTSKHHQCFDQEEIVYLNLYLTSLEKKMQAIEEITRLKWYRQRINDSTGEARNYIRSGFKYFQEDSCKPILSTVDEYSDLSAVSVAPRKPEALMGNSDDIIKEIMSLGSKNYRHEHENSKWAVLVAPKQDPIFSEPNKIVEIDVGADTQVPIQRPSYSLIGKFHVATMSYPSEIHVATCEEEVEVQNPPARIRASCTIEFYENEAKTIEITYDNREWDKKGTIVLRDIENQIGVQTELIGRVVCFLLGMGEVDSVRE